MSSTLLLPPAELYANAGKPIELAQWPTAQVRIGSYREIGFGPGQMAVLYLESAPDPDPNARDGEWRSAAFFPHRGVRVWYEGRDRLTLVEGVVPLYDPELA